MAESPNPEIFLALAAVGLALVAAYFRWQWLGWWERPLAAVARKRRLAIVVAALLPLAVRALLLIRFPAPEPRIHDEFTFLLAADTFAHGRLANPQHPLWPHFESFHMLMRPTYASAFPIAPAAFLALGEVFFGQPWIGVWMGAAFLCGSVCWMLQGCVSPRWAFVGTVLLILRLAVSSYWMNSYWGGFVAAGGGALVLGSVLRSRRTPRWRYAVLTGLGLAILANSRPFEGAVFAASIAVVLVAITPACTLWRIIVPVVPLLALTAAGMAYDSARVTGKPWLFPYVLYRQSTTVAKHFIWQQPRPQPLYDNSVMRDFYVIWEMARFREARDLAVDMPRKVSAYWRFYVGPLLSLPLVMLPLLWRDRRTRPLLLVAVGFSFALIGQVWHNLHYAAPATGLVFLIVILAMRRLRIWRWHGYRIGLSLVRLIPPACALMLGIQIVARPAYTDLPGQAGWRWPPAGNLKRAAILKQLESSPGRHLVFVRYGRLHDPGDEWVFNGADIDGSRVVWARELDRESNAAAIRYFEGRRVWLVEPDVVPVRLIAYADAPPVLIPFVQLGAPGIPAIHSPEEVKRRVLADNPNLENERLGCDAWDTLFSQATGVAAPNPAVADACFPGGKRESPVAFHDWFSWLERQR